MILRSAAVSVLAVAAVLAGCSRQAEAPEQPRPLPESTSGPVVSAPSAVTSAISPCRSDHLKLSAEGGDAGMGHRVAIIGVRNAGAQACSLIGYPGVTLLDRAGRVLTAVRMDQSTSSYLSSGPGPTPIDLAPQAKAYFDIAWTVVPNEGEGETVCPEAATVRFAAPGDATTVDLNQAFTPCGGKVQVRPLRQTAADPVPAAT